MKKVLIAEARACSNSPRNWFLKKQAEYLISVEIAERYNLNIQNSGARNEQKREREGRRKKKRGMNRHEPRARSRVHLNS